MASGTVSSRVKVVGVELVEIRKTLSKIAGVLRCGNCLQDKLGRITEQLAKIAAQQARKAVVGTIFKTQVF